jgi:hypothetical protein
VIELKMQPRPGRRTGATSAAVGVFAISSLL